ncbi:MAG: PDZ domain-containing protein [Acidobacteria bacterium]|jgi:membrane-associated protease RseP (regulator of RpoE activity)|nr:PDZ domain-containing protein [Acidobacteriota bacterium]
MRTALYAILLSTALASAAGAVDCVSTEPFDQSFGFSSDDWGGGGGSYLGVDTRDITADRLGPLHLREEQGVEVTMVDQDAPAGKAGLKEHDVIVSINGTKVESVEQLRRLIREVPPGRVITIGVSRDGQPVALKAQLMDRKKAFAMPDAKTFNFAVPAIPAVPAVPAIPAMPAFAEMEMPASIVVVHSSARSGLMVENLTPQLGDFFGVRNGQGVLVRSVEKGSLAEKSGFRAGDVITRINGQTVADSGDFGRALRVRKDNKVTVSIVRDKKEQTLVLTLPERKQSGVLQESQDNEDLNVETHINLSELEIKLAQLQPKIELVVRQAQEEARKAMEKQHQEMEKQKREIYRQREEIEKQIIRQRNQFHIQLRPTMDI